LVALHVHHTTGMSSCLLNIVFENINRVLHLPASVFSKIFTWQVWLLIDSLSRVNTVMASETRTGRRQADDRILNNMSTPYQVPV
jgi:hypothetical protein